MAKYLITFCDAHMNTFDEACNGEVEADSLEQAVLGLAEAIRRGVVEIPADAEQMDIRLEGVE